jgi:TRAP-type C4-dicarboxylate transport system permease large subunit
MKILKRIIRVVSKVIGYVAGFVLVFSPFTNTGLALMAGSSVVAVICFVAYMWSEPEEGYPQN